MKKAICLILLVVFAGISLNAQEGRKRPEPSREQQERMRKANEMRMKREFYERGMKKGLPGMEMKKEFTEMAMKKRQMEFENYISELEFEKEMRELELEKARATLKGGEKESSCYSSCGKWKGGKHRPGKIIGDIIFCLVLMMMVAVIHILLTIWVFIDVRKRGTSALFIVLTFLTGFMGAFLYALVRIGDKKKK